MWRWPVSPEQALDRARYLDLTHARADIVAVGGEAVGPARALERRNRIASQNGVGRDDIVENRRHEVARVLRDARRQRHAQGSPRHGIHHPGSGSGSSEG
jgi:hypothetical protein